MSKINGSPIKILHKFTMYKKEKLDYLKVLDDYWLCFVQITQVEKKKTFIYIHKKQVKKNKK